MNVYGVVDSRHGETVELFLRREDAEQIVRDWERDEPVDAGLLRVEVIDIEAVNRTPRRPTRSAGG